MKKNRLGIELDFKKADKRECVARIASDGSLQPSMAGSVLKFPFYHTIRPNFHWFSYDRPENTRKHILAHTSSGTHRCPRLDEGSHCGGDAYIFDTVGRW